MSIDIANLISLLKGGMNPRQLAMNIVQERGSNNPIIQNAAYLAQQGDVTGLEQLARNLAQQRNLDFDK